MAGISISPGPMGWRNGCAPNAAARVTTSSADPTCNPMAQTAVPLAFQIWAAWPVVS
jgi:hypothetical protein